MKQTKKQTKTHKHTMSYQGISVNLNPEYSLIAISDKFETIVLTNRQAAIVLGGGLVLAAFGRMWVEGRRLAGINQD